MDNDRQIAQANGWGLASDGLQWILQRQRLHQGQTKWRPVSFVRSSKDILARCMHEKGVPPETAHHLLAGLPPTFDEWHKTRAQGCPDAVALLPQPLPAAA